MLYLLLIVHISRAASFQLPQQAEKKKTILEGNMYSTSPWIYYKLDSHLMSSSNDSNGPLTFELRVLSLLPYLIMTL